MHLLLCLPALPDDDGNAAVVVVVVLRTASHRVVDFGVVASMNHDIDLSKKSSLSEFSLVRRLLTQHCPHMLLRAVLRRSGAFAAERRRLLSQVG